MEPIKTRTTRKGTYYKCIHCGDEIFWNTHKRYTSCSCGKIAIDGCEDYVRIIGNERDYEEVVQQD
ncbi:MAG: hypothetical protein A2666_04370 [Parcubacteria group bacterium RIFCSPHIGHO2_01_FULL_47_10b]|nr:MAG: hypothetical protein A2666_04370 [Parcubacteria group bacterium RIFCSPHIGHO2_01_FULL_47_10b]